MGKLSDKLKEGRVLVSDGAWGTFLYNKGLKPGECPELWSVDRPNDVLEIAESYIDAGSDIIETNSFGASSIKLKDFELDNRAAEINKAAAEISRKAAEDKIVLGSVGPTGKMLLMGDVTEGELYDAFFEQCRALIAGGADAVCIETMMDPEEAKIAVKAAKDAGAEDIVCTYTFEPSKDGSYHTMMGTTPAAAAKAALEAGATVIGANCGNGMQAMADIVKELREAYPNAYILIHANAGLPETAEDGGVRYPETPEETAEFAKTVIEAGADVIGGCCGTTPAHIAALRVLADELNN